MTHAQQGFSLKVLTINTHKGFTSFNRKFILPELREAVRSVSADIVFLQEVLGTHEKHPLRFENWPAAPQYEFLADSMWPEFAYGRNAVYPDGHHGNAVLSKFPIISYDNFDISITGPEKRGMLHCVMRVPDRALDLHVICVHLGLRENHRQQQMRLMCDHINSLPSDAPVIVAGDFNDWRQKANRILADGAGLEEVFMKTDGCLPKTFPARLPLLCLDRIYTRNVDIGRPQILENKPWSHLSDHAPLAAELHL